MARAVVVNAAQLASYSQSKQALLDSGTSPPPSPVAGPTVTDGNRGVCVRRLLQGRHSVPLLCQYDQRPGYHGSVHARGHREDQVSP